MLEEFRVSLFAQQLGTKMPVSEKRLTQQWDKVKQWVIENPL
jgi:ATP-dependent helicase HrpA